uniref:NADH dehydrogenase [ubiquinone] 1 beta subcomplex subunit 2, mitochondrial n=1 Tax=Aceria tosichella TaxID=561515 RepID=A0A6G1SK67_9ACAR
MNTNKLSLFASRTFRHSPRPSNVPARKLYTDQIYPYPYKYFNEKVYPTFHCYRENWDLSHVTRTEARNSIWGMRLFWTYFFWSLFHDPGALFGHHTFPDPSKWTDEELGIPPLEEGPCQS